jgi:hypothetical protein
MSFSRFLVEMGDVKRLTPTVSAGRTIEQWEVVATGVKANIQPVAEEIIALGQGDFYNTFTIYFDYATDVQVGDKYSVDSTVDFIIKGIQKRGYGGRLNHIQASAIRK